MVGVVLGIDKSGEYRSHSGAYGSLLRKIDLAQAGVCAEMHGVSTDHHNIDVVLGRRDVFKSHYWG